eukprot:7785202-Alexandrium_andersonii.AAC.1
MFSRSPLRPELFSGRSSSQPELPRPERLLSRGSTQAGALFRPELTVQASNLPRTLSTRAGAAICRNPRASAGSACA